MIVQEELVIVLRKWFQSLFVPALMSFENTGEALL